MTRDDRVAAQERGTPTGGVHRAALPTDASSLPPLAPVFTAVLDAGLAALGLVLSVGARRGIEAHARLLLAWNAHINLTALRTPEAVARLHVVDALSAVPVLREQLSAAGRPSAAGQPSAAGRPAIPPRILDLGSGGGYPGLPLALTLPAGRISLVDSVTKKGAFLDAACGAALGELEDGSMLGAEVLVTRAEDLARGTRRASWDVVTVRAVGTLTEVAELGLPLLGRGGVLVCWKRDTGATGTLARELEDARGPIHVLGGDAPDVRAVRVPGLETHRLVVVRKSRPTPDRYPRAPAERRRLLR